MSTDATIRRFLDRIESGDARLAAQELLDVFADGMTCTEFVTEVLAPVQRQVGARWESGRWTVVNEHLATSAVDDVLGALSARLEPAAEHKSVALFSAEGEWHATPLRMGALAFREHGWRVHLLGASTPLDHLHSGLRHLRPQIGVVHCALPLNLAGVRGAVEVAHEIGMPVIAAGAAFGIDDHRALRLGCDGWAPDLKAGVRLAGAWLDAPPPQGEPMPSSFDDDLREVRRRRPELEDAAFTLLEQRFTGMASYDERQREHTHRDLAYILDATEATMVVDDPRLLHEFLDWLARLLVARDVPVAALEAGLEALVDASDGELPSLTRLLGSWTG